MAGSVIGPARGGEIVDEVASSSSFPPVFHDSARLHDAAASLSPSLVSTALITQPAAVSTSTAYTTGLSSTFPFSLLATMAGLLTWSFNFFFRSIPGVLYAAVTFLTLTLPKGLFGVLSMNLTFTMNFTTLYVDTRVWSFASISC